MNLTLDIDDKTAQKISTLASEQNMTVEAMVAEYLTFMAGRLTFTVDDTASAAERKANAARLMETFERLSRDLGPRTWTRDDLYEERLGRHGR